MDLPEDLTLPLERGAPWWYWLGGRPALDFINTLRERWRRRVETLVTDEDLAEWLVRAELLSRRPPSRRALLARARELREAHRRGRDRGDRRRARARAGARRDRPRGAVRRAAGRGSCATPTARSSCSPPRPSDPAAHGLGVVARDAARMFGAAQADRIRVCASDDLQRPLLRPLAGGRAALVLQPRPVATSKRPAGIAAGGERRRPHDRSPVWPGGRRRLRHRRSPSPTARAARCATAASTSRSSRARVPYEQVWGLLVDGALDARPRPGRAPRPAACAPATPARTSRRRSRRSASGARAAASTSPTSRPATTSREHLRAHARLRRAVRARRRSPRGADARDGRLARRAVPGRAGAARPTRSTRGRSTPTGCRAAEHGMNASTFTARVVASTGADAAAALSAASARSPARCTAARRAAC